MIDPPLTSEPCEEELKCPVTAALQVGPCPVHTDPVERAVRAVAEAARAVVCGKQRQGICSRLSHRPARPEPSANSPGPRTCPNPG